MVAGGVGLAPFVDAGVALQRAARRAAVLRRAKRRELFYAEFFEQLGVHWCSRPKTARAGPPARHRAARNVLVCVRIASAQAVRLRTDADDARGRAPRRRARPPCEVSLEQVMGCGLGGCYSCVVPTREAAQAPHFVRSCIEGRCSTTRIVWEALVHRGAETRLAAELIDGSG